MTGFSYPLPTFNSSVYNPAFYLSLDATGYLTYEYAQTLYLPKNDFRLTYITGITPGSVQAGVALVLDNSLSLSGIGSISCSSLTVNGSPVSSAPEYVIGITPGTAAASKALVLDSSKNIKGINSLCLGTSTDTARPFSLLNSSITPGGSLYGFVYGVQNSSNNQAELAFNFAGAGSTANSLGIGFHSNTNVLLISATKDVDVPSHDGSSRGLKLGGVLVTASASELNYVDVVRGTAEASKALVLNGSRDISNINQLTADKLVGTLQTAAQPLITSVGTLSSLNVSGGIAGTLQTAAQANITSIGTQTSLNALEYKLNGTLIDFSSYASNTYISGISPGTASASKALVLNSTLDIGGINSLSATQLTGTLQTAAQTLITSVGTLSSLTVSGALNATLTTAAQTNITSVGTLTSLTVSGALNATLATAAQTNITSVGTLTSLTVSGALNATLSTAAQTNITSVGTLTSLTVSGALNATLATAAQTNITSVGTLTGLTVSSSTGVSLRRTDASTNLISYPLEVCHYLTGAVAGSVGIGVGMTFNAPNAAGGVISYGRMYAVSSDVTLNAHAGGLFFSTVFGGSFQNVLSLTSSSTTNSTLALAGSSSTISAANLTGTLTTAAQTNITSVGTLTSLTASGAISAPTLSVNGVDVGSNIQSLVGVTAGTAIASKALVVDATKNVSDINRLNATLVNAGKIELTGKNQVLYSIAGTSEARMYHFNDGDFQLGTISDKDLYFLTNNAFRMRLHAGGVNIHNHNGSSTGLSLNGTLITATAAEINYCDTTPGTAEASKALVVNSDKRITGLNSICFGTSTDNGRYLSMLNSAMVPETSSYGICYGVAAALNNQAEISFSYVASESAANSLGIGFYGNPNIIKFIAEKSVDIPNHNGSTIGLKLGGTLVTATAAELNYVDTTAGTAEASKALVLNADRDIANINNFTATAIAGTLQTAAQPNITSVGTLTSLSTGNITLNGTAITATADEINYLDITTVGTAQASKALIADANKDIIDIRNLTATNLTGTLQTAAQTNITSVGTLTSLSTGSITLGGTAITASADEINYLDITTIGRAQASKALVLNSDGVIRFPSGSRSTNCIQFYNGTEFKETLSIYREDDDSGLTIALTPITPQKSTPVLRLLSGNGLNSGTHPSKIIELIRAEITNTRLVGLDIYTAGLWTIYDYGTTPPWKSSGFADYSQFYSSQPALNIACNTSDTSTYASSNNILLTDQGQVCINTATPSGNYQLTVNKSPTAAGIAVNGNATILRLSNSGGSTSDRTSYEISHNTTWECSLGGSNHSVAKNSLYWYNGGYRLSLSPLGYLGVNTGAAFCPLVVNGFATMQITNIATNTFAYNISNNTWTNLGGGPVSYNISAYFSSAIHVQNTIYCSSDRRLKEDIKPLEISEEQYQKLTPMTYKYKNDDKTKLGLIAQDVMKICNEAIMMNPNEKLEVEEEGDIESVQLNIDYQAILMMTVSIVKRLITEVSELKKNKRANIR